ncbi:MAG: hypothetical protein V7K75_03060 [Nostoc sp.]
MQRHWVILQEQPELASALNNSISAADPSCILSSYTSLQVKQHGTD